MGKTNESNDVELSRAKGWIMYGIDSKWGNQLKKL